MDLITSIKESCYSQVKCDFEKFDLHGWMPGVFLEFFAKALSEKSGDVTVLEVGSWKGRSSNHMAQICKSKPDVNAKIICIDTWLGSPEAIETMERVNGFPTVFKTFINNALFLKNEDIIYPFPIASTQAAHYLISKNFEADIIYIDAGHEYEAVLLDAKLYWKLLKKGGFMIFDDYAIKSVIKAVDEFLADKDAVKVFKDSQVLVHKI